VRDAVLIASDQLAHVLARRTVPAACDLLFDKVAQSVGQGNVHRAHISSYLLRIERKAKMPKFAITVPAGRFSEQPLSGDPTVGYLQVAAPPGQSPARASCSLSKMYGERLRCASAAPNFARMNELVVKRVTPR